MTYWLPKIEAAGLPIPKTILIEASKQVQEDIFHSFDGAPNTDALTSFFQEVEAATAQMGYPCFLRSSYTSLKHKWKETCFIDKPEVSSEHLKMLVYFTECMSFIGLPIHTWAVREFLPTKPVGIAKNYGDMPLTKEFRFFVEDGQVKCFHPYWPRQAIEQGNVEISEEAYTDLCRLDEVEHLTALASRAGEACGGAWSVDFLHTDRGWFLIDMAEAAKSFHWDGCPVSAA